MSHDRNFLNAVVTDIVHLHSQRLDSYRGDYENFIKTKEDRLKNQQREYEAQLQYRQHIQVLPSNTPRTGATPSTLTGCVCVAGFHRQVSVQRQQSGSGPEQTQAAGKAVSTETCCTADPRQRPTNPCFLLQARAEADREGNRGHIKVRRSEIVMNERNQFPDSTSVTDCFCRFPDNFEKLSPPILQLDEVEFYYASDLPLFSGLNLSADLESRICIVCRHQ